MHDVWSAVRSLPTREPAISPALYCLPTYVLFCMIFDVFYPLSLRTQVRSTELPRSGIELSHEKTAGTKAEQKVFSMESDSVIDIIDSDEDSVISMESEEKVVINVDDSDESVVYIETCYNTNKTPKPHRFQLNNKKRRKASSISKENPLFSYSKARKLDMAGFSAGMHTSSHYCYSSARMDHSTTKVDPGCHPSDEGPSYNINNSSISQEPSDNSSRGKWKDFYMFSKDAESEQERLFREAAERVREAKQRAPTSNVFTNFTTSQPKNCFERPIEDVTKLPIMHWTWDNLYARLGLPEGASLQLVKRHYRKLALQYHPDKSDEQDITLANKRFHAIKDAYEQILCGGCPVTTLPS